MTLPHNHHPPVQAPGRDLVDEDHRALDRRIAEEQGEVVTYRLEELEGDSNDEKLGPHGKNAAKGIDRAEVVRLLADEQVTMGEAARRLGTHNSVISHHAGQAVKHGELVKIRPGLYRRRQPEDDRPEPSDRVAESVRLAVEKGRSPLDIASETGVRMEKARAEIAAAASKGHIVRGEDGNWRWPESEEVDHMGNGEKALTEALNELRAEVKALQERQDAVAAEVKRLSDAVGQQQGVSQADLLRIIDRLIGAEDGRRSA